MAGSIPRFSISRRILSRVPAISINNLGKKWNCSSKIGFRALIILIYEINFGTGTGASGLLGLLPIVD
jgi:hypothetical protein